MYGIFTKELYDLTLVNDIADNLFGNINTVGCCPDWTFAATMRAVLYKRLPSEESARVVLINLNVEVLSPQVIADGIMSKGCGRGYSIFIVVPQDRSLWPQLCNTVRASIGTGKRFFTDYVEQEDLHVFYMKKFEGLFYSDGKNELIFLSYINSSILHALQMMIPRYLPSLFSHASLSEDETALLKSLGNKSSYDYERLIEQFASKFNMRDEIIRTRLKGFETAYEREEENRVTQTLAHYRKNYDEHLGQLRAIAKLIQEHLTILSGLQCRLNSSDNNTSELMNYFLCNKKLSIIRVDGASVEFVVRGYADVYDESAVNGYAKNYNSFLYSNISSAVSKEDMEKLYRAVFNDRLYSLCICAAFTLDLKNGVAPRQDYTFPPECKDYLPNPHIQEYGCMGGYSHRIAEYLYNKDYVGAIEQTSVSARNLNFHDSAVMEKFSYSLSCTHVKCIEDADGNHMSPRAAISRMKGGASCQNQSR